MNGEPDWIPPLVLFSDYAGDWDSYLNVIYGYFQQDFVDSSPMFKGRRLRLKRHPMVQGKEATFWHMIQKGTIEEERVPDFRRCERIRWPRPIIEHDVDRAIKVWVNRRRGEKRICLWFVQENYLVILADRGQYILPWTAYLVEQPHRQRKLQREYQEYCRNQSQKG